jgi:hypothetical protein
MKNKMIQAPYMMRKNYDDVIRERLLKSAHHKGVVKKEVHVPKFKITEADEARVASYMPNSEQVILGMEKEEIYQDEGFAVDLFEEYRSLVPDKDVVLFLGKEVFPDFFTKTRTKKQLQQAEMETGKILNHLKVENRSLTMKVCTAQKDLKDLIERNQYNPLYIAEQKKLSKNKQKRIKVMDGKIVTIEEQSAELEGLIKEYKEVFHYFKTHTSQEQMQKRVDTVDELI